MQRRPGYDRVCEVAEFNEDMARSFLGTALLEARKRARPGGPDALVVLTVGQAESLLRSASRVTKAVNKEAARRRLAQRMMSGGKVDSDVRQTLADYERLTDSEREDERALE